MSFLRRIGQRFRPGQDRPAGRIRPVRRVRPARQVKPDRLAAYNTYDAKCFLSQLVARTAGGEEIVIARSGTPVAKLVPYGGEALRPGLVRTHVIVVPDGEAEGRRRADD